MNKKFSQKSFNYLNLSVAVLALLISLPATVNQIRQFFDEAERNAKTTVVYYSASTSDRILYPKGDRCWGSLLSIRFDAYRCTIGNSLLDPCFWVEEYNDPDKAFFSCPDSDSKSDNDLILFVNEEQMDRRYLQDSRTIDLSKDLPWLIYIGNTTCRLSSGAVGTAYGDKGNIYSCKSDEYTSVTSGEVKNEKHYFECKLKGTHVFKKCLAKQVVY